MQQCSDFRHRTARGDHIIQQGDMPPCDLLIAIKGVAQIAPPPTGTELLL